jgi:hypothetical protein
VRTLFVWIWTVFTRLRLDCLIVDPLSMPKPARIEQHPH